ncbi:MAG: hypothetical protein HY323_09455 [Betaproteobacteria bacterium]|nr:hypothetical protein [Betaproteobacteria bacterium]MBI3937191.1 hypothetical protein [Betaproteobacteria bacterium]
MSRTVFLVSPEAPVRVSYGPASARKLDLRGLRLGILDNGKGNADHLLQFVAEGVKALLAVTSVVSRRKASMSTPASGEMLDQLAAEADFVVSAMGD